MESVLGHSYQYQVMRGYLSDSFIQELAMRKLNLTEEQLEELVGRYVRGKRKGMLKGSLTWKKVTYGGWRRLGSGAGNGFVQGRGSIEYEIIDAWTGEHIFGYEEGRTDPREMKNY